MRTSPREGHVSQATDVVVRLLRPEAGRDWNARAGGLEWTCQQTAAHVAHDLAKYAAQLAGRAEHSYLNFRLVISPDVPPTEVLRVIAACGRLLTESVAAAPDAARAWHHGPTDPTGFAAMGVGELLVHAYDIASGFGIDWRPPRALAHVVVSRLLDISDADDPSTLLLWATGRVDLPGRPRVEDWVWRAAVS
jgi:uncharacterized protein (TIGR03083 family)